jgi:outer membrane protein OmpA-like peptidoglycan-associated protein
MGVVFLAVASTIQPAAAQQDREGCEDHPMFNRLEGFYIEGCKEEEFGSYEFNTPDGRRAQEGHFISISYRRPNSAPEMSGLEMIRNHTQAIEAIGGEIVYEGRYAASMKVMVGGREVWVEVSPYGRRAYRLDFVERQAMVQQVFADAEALLADLDRTGRAVLNGLFFDTDMAVLRPESQPALAEIAGLLQAHPEIQAFIVGHTDMTGDMEHNLDLSNRRATAVIDALVQDHGIAQERLTPRGIGPLAPLATNDTESGRALNRRVELVKR